MKQEWQQDSKNQNIQTLKIAQFELKIIKQLTNWQTEILDPRFGFYFGRVVLLGGLESEEKAKSMAVTLFQNYLQQQIEFMQVAQKEMEEFVK